MSDYIAGLSEQVGRVERSARAGAAADSQTSLLRRGVVTGTHAVTGGVVYDVDMLDRTGAVADSFGGVISVEGAVFETGAYVVLAWMEGRPVPCIIGGGGGGGGGGGVTTVVAYENYLSFLADS